MRFALSYLPIVATEKNIHIHLNCSPAVVVISDFAFPFQHPSLRALFDGARPHFLSAAPRGGGISWKRFGAGENDLDGWIYGRVNGSSQ